MPYFSNQHLFFTFNPEAALYKAVHRDGKVITPDGSQIPVEQALFDSGALHGNYISSQFVRKHRKKLKDYRINLKANVVLADNKTRVAIEEAYFLSLEFTDDSGEKHVGTALFWVLPTCKTDMIVGLPGILRSFSSLFKLMIDGAVETFAHTPNHELPLSLQTLSAVMPTTSKDSVNKEVIYPWSVAKDLRRNCNRLH